MNYSNIYQIAANEKFFDNLAYGIISRFEATCKIKDVTIILPTKYACNSLKKTFTKLNSQIPQIHPISDLSKLIKIRTDLIMLDQINLLTKISQIIISIAPDILITELAEYFAKFITFIELHQIDLNKVIEIIDDDLALHKQQLFQYLKQFIHIWQEEKLITKSGYNNILIDNLNCKYLIIAGLNGNTKASYKLIARTITKAKSYVILYGLEDLNIEDINNIDITHGQYNLSQLLGKLSLSTKNIKSWWKNLENKNNFIYESLKPAKSCFNWHEMTGIPTPNLKYICLSDHHQEAKAIIELLKANNYQNAMIVTADDQLMMKIILHLKMSNIDANIVYDYPLQACSKATWLKLCLNFFIDKFSITSALSMLKHPLMQLESSLLQRLELCLRNQNYVNIFEIKLEDEELNTLISKMHNEIQKLMSSFNGRSNNFINLLHAHLNFAENMMASFLEKDELDNALDEFLNQLNTSKDLNIEIATSDYSKMFNYLLKFAYYRKAVTDHPITLLKPIDSRLHSADLVILAGLNENIWPSKPNIDPCFNRQLLNKIGLPPAEQSISEEAYDFQCLAQAKEVILTRSAKISGVSTSESRWLLRILTLARKFNFLDEMIIKTSINHKTAQILTSTTNPLPPIKYRPKVFSVTSLEKLVFNPYHIYVDLILGLKKLPTLVKEASARDFGNFIHKSLEIHQKQKIDLISAGKKALMDLDLSNTLTQILWWPRFLRIAEWIGIRQNQQQSYLESFGKINIDDYIIKAKADLIEIFDNNKIHIIDYKTGNITNAKAIYSGLNLQLTLEAIIAEEKGFYWQRQEQQYQVTNFSYIQLSGGEEPVEILTIDLEKHNILSQCQEYIKKLFAEYSDPNIPYYYTNKKTLGYCEYQHLARKF